MLKCSLSEKSALATLSCWPEAVTQHIIFDLSSWGNCKNSVTFVTSFSQEFNQIKEIVLKYLPVLTAHKALIPLLSDGCRFSSRHAGTLGSISSPSLFQSLPLGILVLELLSPSAVQILGVCCGMHFLCIKICRLHF